MDTVNLTLVLHIKIMKLVPKYHKLNDHLL
jgi:hypothetical protein